MWNVQSYILTITRINGIQQTLYPIWKGGERWRWVAKTNVHVWHQWVWENIQLENLYKTKKWLKCPKLHGFKSTLKEQSNKWIGMYITLSTQTRQNVGIGCNYRTLHLLPNCFEHSHYSQFWNNSLWLQLNLLLLGVNSLLKLRDVCYRLCLCVCGFKKTMVKTTAISCLITFEVLRRSWERKGTLMVPPKCIIVLLHIQVGWIPSVISKRASQESYGPEEYCHVNTLDDYDQVGMLPQERVLSFPCNWLRNTNSPWPHHGWVDRWW